MAPAEGLVGRLGEGENDAAALVRGKLLREELGSLVDRPGAAHVGERLDDAEPQLHVAGREGEGLGQGALRRLSGSGEGLERSHRLELEIPVGVAGDDLGEGLQDGRLVGPQLAQGAHGEEPEHRVLVAAHLRGRHESLPDVEGRGVVADNPQGAHGVHAGRDRLVLVRHELLEGLAHPGVVPVPEAVERAGGVALHLRLRLLEQGEEGGQAGRVGEAGQEGGPLGEEIVVRGGGEGARHRTDDGQLVRG